MAKTTFEAKQRGDLIIDTKWERQHEAEVYFGWSIPHKGEPGSFVAHNDQQLMSALAAKTGTLIRRPVADVFEAFIEPDITTKFWFTKSSGRLKVGRQVKWDGKCTATRPK
ncbi:MAG TPA: hypothetical protein VJ875_06850 [Pyrinomonadaceae bacterium]|nr:hypothetical protein [Pyrinomonadaceae bacterium]